MSDNSLVFWITLSLIVLTAGTPDVLDGIVHLMMKEGE